MRITNKIIGKLKTKIKFYSNYKKENGIFNTIRYFVGNMVFIVVRPLYVSTVSRFCEVNPKKMLFMSFPDYSDNAKVLYEYFAEKSEDYSYTWVVKSDKYSSSNQTVFINGVSKNHAGLSLKTLREVLTSKYLFFSHSSPVAGIKKRQGQVVVNLWHGCGYKDRVSKKPWILSNPFDYVLVPGNVFIGTKSHFFGCRKEQVIPIGYPRYDLLSKENEESMLKVSELKKNNSKIIVWMPTYRKTASGSFGVEKIEGYFELPILSSTEQLVELNAICKDNNILLCVKRHPFQTKYECEDLKLSNICFISNDYFEDNGIELYSFLKYTDALITDYSSIGIDYLLLNKPIAYALNDFKDYKDAQGFVFDDPLKYMPGMHLFSYEDLLQFISDLITGVDKFKSDREMLMSEVHNPCDDYCKRIGEYFDLVKGK